MATLQPLTGIFIPRWDDLDALMRSASRSLLLCSPYISTEGVNRVFDFLNTRVDFEVVTRLSPSDWANGISDPEALLTLLKLLSEDGWSVSLWVHQRLHAKAYIADTSTCLVGSANLSTGGFDNNFELAVSGETALAVEVMNLIRSQLDAQGKALDIDSLARWVEESAALVAASVNRDQESDALAEPQRRLDALLGRGGGRLKQSSTLADLAKFADWLRQNVSMRGARILLDRHENISGQNLQGHVKQTFGASQLFLAENRDLLESCRLSLDEVSISDVPNLADEVITRWNRFVDDNADYKDDAYDFAVLTGYLPPSLGGTRSGGGGGSSTLKRMLPLVAQFLAHHR